jgi:hypothetical protein
MLNKKRAKKAKVNRKQVKKAKVKNLQKKKRRKLKQSNDVG